MTEDGDGGNNKVSSRRTEMIWCLFICVALVILIMLVLSRRPAKVINPDGETDAVSSDGISSDETESGEIIFEEISPDDPDHMRKVMEQIALTTFQHHHEKFKDAIREYIEDNYGTKPQSIDDLADYVDLEGIHSRLSSATYQISVDEDDLLTLVSSYDGAVLAYTKK